MNPVWLAGGIFLITYSLIVTERVHRTIAALMGGVAIILFGVLEQDQAFHSIDWNVIFLLAGMMMIASILSETGSNFLLKFSFKYLKAARKWGLSLTYLSAFSRLSTITNFLSSIFPFLKSCWLTKSEEINSNRYNG